MTDLRYPIGEFSYPGEETADERRRAIDEIEATPVRLRAAVQGLSPQQLDTPYRSGGWTVRQVVHHVPDSHLNAYTRFKLALTEDDVTVKSYEEQLWAELADVKALPVNISITLLHALHSRLYAAIKDLRVDQWNRTLNYPGKPLHVTIWFLLGMYSWHGKHHTAHIQSFRKANQI